MKLVCFHSFKRATINPLCYRGKLLKENFAKKKQNPHQGQNPWMWVLCKFKLAGLFSKKIHCQ